MGKPRLLALVGAGASIELGIPSVNAVDHELDKEASRFYALADGSGSNLFRLLRDRITAHRRLGIRDASKANFEDVLYAAVLSAATEPAGYYTSVLGAVVNRKVLVDVTTSNQTHVRSIDANELIGFASKMSDRIVDFFRHHCEDIPNRDVSKRSAMTSFFWALEDAFDVAYVTLNYDDLIWQLRSGPGLATGFTKDGTFDEAKLFDRRGWPCLVHLHGSVHFDMQVRNGNLHEVCWNDNPSASQNAHGRDSMMTDGMPFPMAGIVAGRGKTAQILKRPFRSYYSELDRLISSSNALLCLGYGFGDEHLNIALQTYRSHRRKVVVIDWANDDDAALQAITKVDGVQYTRWDGLYQTFAQGAEFIGTRSDDWITCGDFKSNAAFDRTNDDVPMAVWYGGMIEACKQAHRIVTELNSGSGRAP